MQLLNQRQWVYLRGSAFVSAAEPKVGWFSTKKKKQYNFPALPYPIGQSLLYPPVLTVSPGKFVFCTKSRRTICIFGSLTLCHKVSRSNLRSRPALPYERHGAQHWMLCCPATAQCAAGQPTIQYRPVLTAYHPVLTVGRAGGGGRYWMLCCPAAH